MTLEQLRIFVAVAEREHVTKAAADLNLTQSATSAAVAALEGRYSTRLFDRVGRRIVLTEAGKLFLVEAKAVLSRAAAAETVLSDLSGLKKGRLLLSASQTVASYWLPPLMHRYQQRYPGVSLSLAIANTETVATMIHDGAAEIGIVEGEIDDDALTKTVVADDEMVLVVGRGHPWAGRGEITSKDIAGAAWVVRESGSGTRVILETLLEKSGVPASRLESAMEFTSNEAVRTAVEAGAGASVVSRLVVEASIASGLLVEVPFAIPNRRFWALRHRERYATKAATAFLDEIGGAAGGGAP